MGDRDAAGYLVYGATGWIGSQICKLLEERCEVVIRARSRLEHRESVERELAKTNPLIVVCAAGVTGRPNVDWCEDNKEATLRANVIGALTLADACSQKGVYLAYFGSGCIYEYDECHPIGGRGFAEDEAPNYDGSFYSFTKIAAERLLAVYPSVLQLRLRMPVSADLHSRSLITKLLKYDKLVDVPNSISVLPDLLPVALDMMAMRKTGVYNFVNPGVVSHNEIMSLYKKYVDSSLSWENFSLEEQAKILKAGRSNNRLDVSKLMREHPDIPDVHDALSSLFSKMGK